VLLDNDRATEDVRGGRGEAQQKAKNDWVHEDWE
jgi:hypothetical protein